MGMTRLNIEIGHTENLGATETVELLVDSGAMFSVVPGPILERLGIRPHTEQRLRLADGSQIVRRRGGALFQYGDREGIATVIFGEPNDGLLLGVTTLESLGLGLDPVRGELIDIQMTA